MSEESRQEPLEAIYRLRFNERDLANKRVLWDVLVRDFFQKYVPRNGTVVDLGAGNCEFVNVVRARRRIAVDLNPATSGFAATGVDVMLTSADSMPGLADSSVDTVFTSNFFEHLPNKRALLDTLAECHRVTRPAGRIVVLMPNIRYLPGRYWDYLDHHLPLTHLSMGEALELSGFQVTECVPRFLPYTVKDARLKVRPAMVSAYLRLRPAWHVLGRQMLVVGLKT